MKNVIPILTMIVFFALGIPGLSSATTMFLSATEDTGLLDGDPRNDPFPGIIYSELDTTGPGSVYLSVLKFDLSSLAGMTINSASFELTSIFNHNSGTFFHEVFSSSDDSWTEGTVTGINRPSDSTLTLLDSVGISGVSQAYSWDVLSGVVGLDGLAGTNNLLTLLVRPDLSQAGTAFGPHFNDRNDSSGFPRLIIDATTTVPEPSTMLLFASGLIGLVGYNYSRNKKTV